MVAAIIAVVAINPFADRDAAVEFAIISPSVPDGIGAGVPVDIRGETVGEVCQTDISRREVTRLVLCMQSSAMGELTDEAGVSFVSRNAFGSDAVRLTPVSTGRPLTADGILTLSQPPGDYTITATMRSAGAFTLPVLTPELGALLTQVSDATIRLAPFLTAGTVLLQTMERGAVGELTGRLPTVADALDGAAQAGVGAVGALQTVIGNRLLADDEYVTRVSSMIADIGGLFSDLGALFNGMSGLGATMDLMTAFTTPLMASLRGVSSRQIAELITRFGGAFHTDPATGKVTLAVDVELDSVPGVTGALNQLIAAAGAH